MINSLDLKIEVFESFANKMISCVADDVNYRKMKTKQLRYSITE